MVSLCLGLTPFAVLSTIAYAKVAPAALTVVLAGGCLVFFAVPFAIRWGVSIEHAVVLWGVYLVGSSTTFAAHSGGASSSAFAWIVVIPVFGGALAGRKVGVVMAMVSVVAACGLVIVQHTVGLPPSFIEPALMLPGFLVTALILPLLLLLSSTFTHQIADLAIADVQRINKELQREVTQHENTRNELEGLQAELVVAARVAGMAEVATGVLHNVGNALNSVNVSVGVAEQRLCDEPSDLSRVSALLRQSEPVSLDRLATVADYLDRVARAGEIARAESVSELGRIREGAENIAAVVRAQQGLARSVSVSECVRVCNLIDQAALLVSAQLSDNGVLLKLGECTQQVVVDRHRVVQILVNLLSNAGDACVGVQNAVVRVHARVQNGVLDMDVEDNGTGITEENLTRVFQHGFTTKPTGFGFGLHASALSARALGGDLTATSDGAGLGATFRLTVPVEGHS